MKEIWCILAFISTSIVLLILAIRFIVKNRMKIYRYIKKKQIVKFLVNVLTPALLPFILSIVALKLDDVEFMDGDFTLIEGVILFIVVLTGLNFILQLVVWIRDTNSRDLQWENLAAKHAYNGLFEIQMSKNTQLRSAHHNGLERGIITQADVPYNIFDQIRKITWEFAKAIGKITDIDTKNIEASFIYRYIYDDANINDQKWRWITGKGAKFKHSLKDFTEITDSTFHYMSNNNVESLFYDDKKQAMKDQCYLYSYRDRTHDLNGSIFAAKVAFSGNDKNLCEGIIMVNTYGQQFLKKLSPHTEDELRKLLVDNIFPCYSKMLMTELAMLYFCHITEPDPSKYGSIPLKMQKKDKWNIHKKSSGYIMAATKKIWRKIK